MPILTAILGLSAGLGIIALISHTAEVPTSAPTLATMIGLGVGIDYALFIVTRHRSQLAEGMEPRESVARATATAGGAVVFAGGTVIIALLSLAAAGIPLVTTLGFTAAIVVVVAASAATTLLPTILTILDRRQRVVRRARSPGGADQRVTRKSRGVLRARPRRLTDARLRSVEPSRRNASPAHPHVCLQRKPET